MPPKKKENKEDLSFELALEELEKLTESMEGRQLSLTELVSAYERGDQLLKYCRKSLDSARKKIELIQAKANASNDDSTDPPDSPGGAEPNDQDVRLF